MPATQRTFGSLAESPRAPQQSVQSPQTRSRAQSKPKARAAVSLMDKVSIFGCIAVSALALWFLGMKGASIYSINYHLTELQVTEANLAATNASLTERVDQLSQPTRILHLAMTTYGMQHQTPVQIPVGNSQSH